MDKEVKEDFQTCRIGSPHIRYEPDKLSDPCSDFKSNGFGIKGRTLLESVSYAALLLFIFPLSQHLLTSSEKKEKVF